MPMSKATKSNLIVGDLASMHKIRGSNLITVSVPKEIPMSRMYSNNKISRMKLRTSPTVKAKVDVTTTSSKNIPSKQVVNSAIAMFLQIRKQQSSTLINSIPLYLMSITIRT